MTRPIILSYVQARPILEARRKGLPSIEVSPDLGLTMVMVSIRPEGVVFPSGEQLGWKSIEKICKSTVNCFVVEHDGVRPIQVFSETTNRVCSLMPTEKAPSMLIAGFVMHRIKDIDPYADTLRKIAAIAPVVGQMLDTATGLGYTAIEAARTAEGLFDNPKIRQVMGDAFEVVQTFEDQSFSRIIHDPPTFSLAGELYSGEFYRQMFRVLKRGGRLFHYVGDPNSKASGGVTRGVIRRLREAGFARVVRRPEAFGLVAYK